jgi:chorismate synthase
MPGSEASIASPEFAAALEAFHPERFGFRRFGGGWVRDFADYGPVAITPLSWPHAQVESYDRVDGQVVATDALGLIANLQQTVWGFPPELVVPTNVMAIIPDSGGAVLAAYQIEKGFNADGWLGFAIGLGARNGTLVSHMLAVREGARGASDFGWFIKIIQAYEALQTGHTAMAWTFDPMRGANAKLNLEKLGAVVKEFTHDKYGVLPSVLYGNVPSDRFTAHWDMLDPRTADRIAAVHDGSYRSCSLADAMTAVEATSSSVTELVERGITRLRYQIPGDIDLLMQTDAERAIEWRREMRQVLSTLLKTKWARLDGAAPGGPIAVEFDSRPGEYLINGFATETDSAGERISYYLLERHPY